MLFADAAREGREQISGSGIEHQMEMATMPLDGCPVLCSLFVLF
ncbi:hypothetical protein [Bradyrhizobium agreste]|nr:hypothetical protein [Bradyrhizobium agreste]